MVNQLWNMKKITKKTTFLSLITALSCVIAIPRFLFGNYDIFTMKRDTVNNKRIEEMPENRFPCCFKKKFFEEFRIFKYFRKPYAWEARNSNLAVLRPPKSGITLSFHLQRENFGICHTKVGVHVLFSCLIIRPKLALQS